MGRVVTTTLPCPEGDEHAEDVHGVLVEGGGQVLGGGGGGEGVAQALQLRREPQQLEHPLHLGHHGGQAGVPSHHHLPQLLLLEAPDHHHPGELAEVLLGAALQRTLCEEELKPWAGRTWPPRLCTVSPPPLPTTPSTATASAAAWYTSSMSSHTP